MHGPFESVIARFYCTAVACRKIGAVGRSVSASLKLVEYAKMWCGTDEKNYQATYTIYIRVLAAKYDINLISGHDVNWESHASTGRTNGIKRKNRFSSSWA